MKSTLIGLCAVLIWGASIPISRLFEDRLGISATMGTAFVGSGLLGLLSHVVQREPFPQRAVFRNPYLYGRWLFFVMHEACIMSAILIVREKYIPIVILINYLWPTAVILFSVVFADVTITRWYAFIMGSIVVIASLGFELVGPRNLTSDIFAVPSDQLAYSLAFIGAVSWGLYCAFTRRAGDASGGGSVIPFFQLTLGLTLPISFLPNFSHWGNLTGWWPAFLVAYALLQFLAYLSWDYGVRRGSLVLMSLCADLIPWISLFISSLLLQVDIGLKTVITAICLVIGAMIARYGTLQKKADALEEEQPQI